MGSNKDKDELMLGLLLKLVILILFNIELVFELEFLPLPWLFLAFSDDFWLFLIAARAHNSKASEILWVSLGNLADVST